MTQTRNDRTTTKTNDGDQYCHHHHDHGNDQDGKNNKERDWDCAHMTPRQHSTTHHSCEPCLWGRKGSYREGSTGPLQDNDDE